MEPGRQRVNRVGSWGRREILRVLGALLLASSMMAGGAQASSFVVVAPPKDKISSSFVVVGAPPLPVLAAAVADAQPENGEALVVPLAFPLAENGTSVSFEPSVAAKVTKISTSIIAFDSPIPNVAYEKVAAITPDKPVKRPLRLTTPMVMRGGIIGDAYASGSSGAAPVAVQAPGRSAAKPTGRPRVARKPGEPAPEEPVKIIIAPPPPTMPKLDGVR